MASLLQSILGNAASRANINIARENDAPLGKATSSAGTKRPRAPEEEANAPLKVKLLSDNATVPARGSKGAAGYDLSSAVAVSIPPRERKLVKTDLSIAIPENTYARIAPRSGLAYKKSVDVAAGVVDYDYRGNVGVILVNNSNEETFEVAVGDRIAQLILERIVTPEVVQVDDLDDTDRGEGGFGSTGVKKQ